MNSKPLSLVPRHWSPQGLAANDCLPISLAERKNNAMENRKALNFLGLRGGNSHPRVFWMEGLPKYYPVRRSFRVAETHLRGSADTGWNGGGRRRCGNRSARVSSR